MSLKIPDKGEIANTGLNYRKIIDYVDDGNIHIPDFQRKFVWTKNKILDLLDSIYKGYPIGSFIFWVTDQDFVYSSSISGKEIKSNPFNAKYFVIDGQQRLKSLYHAAKSKELEMRKDQSNLSVTKKIDVIFDLEEKQFMFKEDVYQDKNRSMFAIPEIKGPNIIIDVLEAIKNNNYDDLLKKYNINERTLNRFLRSLRTMDLVDSKSNPILTELGKTILENEDFERIGNILYEKCHFIKEVLEIIKDNPGINRKDGAKLFDKIYQESENTAYYQFGRRCRWLKALKLIKSENKGHYITESGENFLRVIQETEKEEMNKRISLNKILDDDLDLEYLSSFNKEIRKEINELRKKFNNYEFSIIVVNKTDWEDVCNIFERINTMGQHLTVVDLMIAKTWSGEEFNLREKLKILKDEIHEEDLPDMTILQALSLNICQKCRRKDILELDTSDIKANWDKAAESMRKAIDFVKHSLCLPSLKILPYPALLVPLSWFYFQSGNTEPSQEQIEKLKKWFWKASISNRFDSAVESKLEKDGEIISKIQADEPAEFKYSYVPRSPEDIVEQKFSLGNAFSKTILCLFASEKPINPVNNNPILVNRFSKYTQSEMHHIFPKNYLRRQGEEDSKINSIVNIMFLPANINKGAKFKTSPKEYLTSINNPQLEKALKTHLVLDLDESGLMENNFDKFLLYRARQIVKKLKEASGEERAFTEGRILSPETPFTNEMYLRELIRKSDSYVYWFDKYFTRKGLEFLSQDIDPNKVKEIRILTGTKQTNSGLRNDFKKFKEEMENMGIKVEMRIMKDEDSNEIHDRWIVSENQCFNVPSINTIGRKQYSEIKKSSSKPPFLDWWSKGLDILEKWNDIQKIIQ